MWASAHLERDVDHIGRIKPVGERDHDMEFPLETCTVRSWRTADAADLAQNANNRNVWINLRDAFPYPYQERDALAWIRSTEHEVPETNFAITVINEAIGAIGFRLGTDVDRRTAEIGYWIGEPFWGRGIGTEAVTRITEYAMTTHDLTRVWAMTFEWAGASARVLEKAGYALEGRLRRSAVKDGKVIDQLLYAFTGDE